MRTASVGALIVSLFAGPAATVQSDLGGVAGPRDDAARTVLRQARDALGGERALGAVRGLKGVGRSSRLLGPMRFAGDIDLRLALPDRYVRIDQLLFGTLSAEIATGFNGHALIQRARGPDGLRLNPTAGIPPSGLAAAERAAMAGVRQDAALLLLGFFCASLDLHPLHFTYAGEAESPDGAAKALDITGPDGLRARLFIDRGSHLPLLVTWMGPDVAGAARAMGGPVPVVSPDPALLLAQLQPVEHRLYFGDYRPVGALRWPFRLQRSVAGQVSEDVTFDSFTINPAVDARLFDVGR